MKTIEERIATLERANQQWKLGAIMACVAGIAAFFTGADAPKQKLDGVLMCKSLMTEEIICIKNDKPVIRMGAGGTEHESGVLVFYNPASYPKLTDAPIVLSVLDNNGIIGMNGSDGAYIRLDGGKAPSLSIRSSLTQKPFAFASFGVTDNQAIELSIQSTSKKKVTFP